MIIVGGAYLEHCVAPTSDSLLGSAGRAALGLSGLTSAIALHTFFPAQFADQIRPNFEPFGIQVHLYPSPARIAFHYLHPLARPRIFPIPLPQAGTVEVCGDTILRFGCLEGDFRVKAKTAVYDPQSGMAPLPFSQNGSVAERLAIVLNRGELLAQTGIGDINAAAEDVLQRENADVIVIKSGPAGAFVFHKDGAQHHVPAFESRAIFKIGSGDVFSAAFAYYWAECNLAPETAARLASLHVAEYVESRRLIFVTPTERKSLSTRSTSKIGVLCNGHGSSSCWLIDEILASLKDLGLVAEQIVSLAESRPDVLFIALQYADNSFQDIMDIARGRGIPIVIYAENIDTGQAARLSAKGDSLYTDLTTALYRAAWI